MGKDPNLKTDASHVVCPACGDLLDVDVVVGSVEKYYELGLKVKFESQVINHVCKDK